MKFKQLALTAAIATIPAFAFAANPAATLVNQVTNGQATIQKEFKSIGNLEGFVVSPTSGQGQDALLYADKNGKYLIAGSIINSQGQNISQMDYQKYISDPMSPKIFAAAKSANWFQEGKSTAPHQAYVIIEPNCIACHMLYKQLKPMITSGQLAVRWITVAFMKQDSMSKAAALLQANNPSAALALDESGFNVKTEEGGVTPASKISAAVKAKIQANNDFMQQYGFVGTPVIIYKDTAGQAQVVRGFIPGKALLDTVKKMGSWS